MQRMVIMGELRGFPIRNLMLYVRSFVYYPAMDLLLV
jgi:hypothetical protein